MNLGVVQASDLLRTGGAIYLLTRKSKLAKFLGVLWLGGEIYSLTLRERGLVTGPTLAEKLTGDAAPAAVTPSMKGLAGYLSAVEKEIPA